LSDALEAARRGAGATSAAPSVVPIPHQVVKRLLQSAADRPARRMLLEIDRARSLHHVARSLERQMYQRLFEECGGSFEAMARQLLGEAGPKSARRVRLRFNQLGLRARKK